MQTRTAVEPIELGVAFLEQEDKLGEQYVYGRRSNPNRRSLELLLASLEGAEDCSVFSSGCGALAAFLMCLPKQSHILIPADGFFLTPKIARRVAALSSLEIDYVDFNSVRDLSQYAKKNTSAILVEAVSNPLLELTDLSHIIQFAKQHRILVACDNTVATPVYCAPLSLGADVVIFSTTKYLNGHGDSLGGALAWRKDLKLGSEIKSLQGDLGLGLGPMDAWLTLRGAKTFNLRINHQSNTAASIADALEDSNLLKKIYYPTSPRDGKRTPFGALFSFETHGGLDFARRFVSRLKKFDRATSFGYCESSVEIRDQTEPNSNLPSGLVRIAVGLEDKDSLLADILQALNLTIIEDQLEKSRGSNV